MKRHILALVVLLTAALPGHSQDICVDTVHLIFKTHLDIGYTDFSCNVEKKYIERFIPQAIVTAQKLREEGGEERYVWTTGAWLIDSYLKHSGPEACRKMEEAIRRGDIHWNAMPYTIETESAGIELLGGMLGLSASLDRRFGRKTVAAKMTDVPGHTRGIVPILADRGIRMLHVGVNGCSTVPEVPSFFRWCDAASGKEVMVCYDSQYGGGNVLPDHRTAVEIAFTGDNEGPHSIESVRRIYSDLHRKYPGAAIVAGSLDDVAAALERCRDSLPCVTSEIGDTWIYGYASSPMKIARFRALSALYSKWIGSGRLDPGSALAANFAVRLGLVTEHTWGSRGREVGNFHIYGMDSFGASRNLPAFRYAEMTWKEQEMYVDQAAAMLPEPLKTEAMRVLDSVTEVGAPGFKPSRKALTEADSLGRYRWKGLLIGGISYQSYSPEDYAKFRKEYVRVYNPGFDKVDLGRAQSPGGIVDAVPGMAGKTKNGVIYRMRFPKTEGIDPRVYPEDIWIEYSGTADGLDMTVTVKGKPAVRLPEALWVSFPIEGITGITAEKTGSEIDLLDVVPGGNRRMHFIDGHADILAGNRRIRITSPDAPVLTIGERNGIGYTRAMPDLSEGVHFCLFNNLWSTNFNLWWEGDIRCRFHIEIR